MRIGVRSGDPLAWLAECAGMLPTPLLVTFWGMEASRAVIAGQRLGFFEALADGPLTAGEVAAATACDETGTGALLTALAGFGFLRRRRGGYRLTRASRRYLLAGSRLSLAGAFPMMRLIWDELGDVEERVREGAARDFHRAGRDEAWWRTYETGLAHAARLTAPAIARLIRFERPPLRLLDVGGGHGMYAAALCRAHPGLQATVLDLPPACEIGAALVAEAGMADRVAHRPGDLMADEWGAGHDAVLLFNLLHVFTPAQCEDILRRAHDALAPGGVVAVLDAVHAGGTNGVSAVAGGSELLFYLINGTSAYPEADIVAWMRAAGFERVRRHGVPGIPEALITAHRPAD